MATFEGRYIHEDDLKNILSQAGLSISFDDQPSTRRTVMVNGEPTGRTQVVRDDATGELTVG